MKKLIILLCCFIATISSFAQTNNINLNNLEYIEMRVTPFNGWQFRTSPRSGFQKMGFMKYKLRGYLKENKEAMKYFRKHNWAITGMYSASIVSGLSLVIGMANASFSNNSNLVPLVIGGSVFVLSYGAAVWLSNMIYKHLQTSIDIYNQSKNPNLSTVQPFIPKIQASSHSLGLGLVWSI